MAVWRYKIRLNEALEANNEEFDLSRHEEDCPVAAKERIAEQLELSPPLVRFATRVRECKSIAEVNRVLVHVFDEADSSRVWCGGI